MTKLISAFMAVCIFFFNLFTGAPLIGSYDGQADEVKNVIYLIGDGMGYNHWELCKQETGGTPLFCETGFEYYGYSHTRSSSNKVTDSAAGGTALATGVKTSNGQIGTYFYDKNAKREAPENLCELAISMGKKTGIITSDSNCGATPGAFSAHCKDRDMSEEITAQQLESGIDLIWSSSSGLVKDETVKDTEYTLVNDWDELNALEDGEKSFGQFDAPIWALENDKNCPTLSELTSVALDRLDNDENGFFIMIEGAHIDKHSHNQNAADMAIAMREFDKVIKEALEFAEEDGNTLVVLTADHETGKIIEDNGVYKYTQGSHSATDVPCCIYGSDDFIKDDAQVNNVDIAAFTASAMGAEAESFPVALDFKKKK